MKCIHPARKLSRDEALAGLLRIRAEIGDLCFVSFGNVFPKHDWGPGGTCKRCGEPTPELNLHGPRPRGHGQMEHIKAVTPRAGSE